MSNTTRRTSMTYPNGRVVNLGYGSSDSIDDLFSLVKSAAISGESGNKVEYSRAGLGRFVKIAYSQPGVEMSMLRPGGGSEGDSGDAYDGYDRFGRVQEMRWQSSSTGTPIDAWQWGYNEASNRTWKKNLVATSGQDEAYAYDGLYQVTRDAVGTLNTNRTAIGGVPGEEEDFTYDPTGNWLGYRRSDDGTVVLDQSRSNNKDNQLTQIDGDSALLAYDRAGNAETVAPGAGGDWSKCYRPIWDAWNRIVEVKDENWTTVQKNAYDGLSRRITKEAASVVTHTYWSDRWKPLEERTGSASTAARSYLWVSVRGTGTSWSCVTVTPTATAPLTSVSTRRWTTSTGRPSSTPPVQCRSATPTVPSASIGSWRRTSLRAPPPATPGTSGSKGSSATSRPDGATTATGSTCHCSAGGLIGILLRRGAG
jgi:hypothetical protein